MQMIMQSPTDLVILSYFGKEYFYDLTSSEPSVYI